MSNNQLNQVESSSPDCSKTIFNKYLAKQYNIKRTSETYIEIISKILEMIIGSGIIITKLAIHFKEVQVKMDSCSNARKMYKYIYRHSSLLTFLGFYALRVIVRLVLLLKNGTTCNMQPFLRQDQGRRLILGTTVILTSIWGLLILHSEIRTLYRFYILCAILGGLIFLLTLGTMRLKIINISPTQDEQELEESRNDQQQQETLV